MITNIAYPRQVILVSCRAEVKVPFTDKLEQKDNIITLSWHSPLSFTPELYGIMISKERFSYNLIKKSGVFVVNFMPASQKAAILGCGSRRGDIIDKFKEFNLNKLEAEKIDCPIIKEALAAYECEVIQEIETGDHVVFVGKILKTLENIDGKRLFQKGNKFLEV